MDGVVGMDGQARPTIAKSTPYPDGLLVEWSTRLVIFYRAAFLWEQRDYSRAEREHREVRGRTDAP